MTTPTSPPPHESPAPRRLYMDNAATSRRKARAVMEAMARYASELGASAGRGAYAEAVETGRLMNECRRRLNRLFHGERPEHFVFTLNCSDALNLAIKGLIDPERGPGHAICTHIDHNSILRPLHRRPRPCPGCLVDATRGLRSAPASRAPRCPAPARGGLRATCCRGSASPRAAPPRCARYPPAPAPRSRQTFHPLRPPIPHAT